LHTNWCDKSTHSLHTTHAHANQRQRQIQLSHHPLLALRRPPWNKYHQHSFDESGDQLMRTNLRHPRPKRIDMRRIVLALVAAALPLAAVDAFVAPGLGRAPTLAAVPRGVLVSALHPHCRRASFCSKQIPTRIHRRVQGIGRHGMRAAKGKSRRRTTLFRRDTR
jgi:hypothetical protein